MFCRQCEQAVGGKACAMKTGVCGKDDRTSALQDLLVHAITGIAIYGKMARDLGVAERSVDNFLIEGLFTTVTNVNFDPERLAGIIKEASSVKKKIKDTFEKAYKKRAGESFAGVLPAAASWEPANSMEGLVEQGEAVGIMSDKSVDEDIRSLREILLYGLKGMAAYADHAAILGEESEEVNANFYASLMALADNSLSADDLIGLIMKFGKANLKCMEILDKAHTERYGHPVPTKVSLGARKGPAILVSGHDLPDLEQLLEQTKDKGINIYTHGEMLPAHGYPGLKKYKHLAGHFGGAWQDQQKEFPDFPGAILFTTNCIQKPLASYDDRVFTTGLVAWPGIEHVYEAAGKKDFSKVIEKALETGGYAEDVAGKEILVGFGHNTVLGVADKVIDGVKSGKIKHFFLIGGCDGAKPGRNYYTEFAEKVPDDSVILTLACGKFRFNKMEFGSIGEIPRLLDCGQCNDAYSAIKIALALSDAFECSVNDLPLSMILSWYEQKAVCILLTLFSLGIKGIKLGPSLPAFVSPNVLKVLVDNFGISPISTADKDMEGILGAGARK